MTTNTLPYEAALHINQLCKRWYRGPTPRIFVVEDQPESQQGLEVVFRKAFPAISLSIADGAGFAKSVQGVREALDPRSTGKTLYDVLVLDYRILDREDEQQFAGDSSLQQLHGYLGLIQQTTARFVIRVTAHVAEALEAGRKMADGEGDFDQMYLTTAGCLIEKDPNKWIDLVLAYVYRTMVLEECVRLTQQFATFDFEQLNGRKPMARVRSLQTSGLAEFEEFRQQLQTLWPLLKNWPEDSLQTGPQLEGLRLMIERHFKADESELDLAAGTGGVRLSLLYRPENQGVCSPAGHF